MEDSGFRAYPSRYKDKSIKKQQNFSKERTDSSNETEVGLDKERENFQQRKPNSNQTRKNRHLRHHLPLQNQNQNHKIKNNKNNKNNTT